MTNIYRDDTGVNQKPRSRASGELRALKMGYNPRLNFLKRDQIRKYRYKSREGLPSLLRPLGLWRARRGNDKPLGFILQGL